MNPLEPAEVSATEEASSNAMLELQRQLWIEFVECDADSRPCTAHLSLGQCDGEKQIERLADEIEMDIGSFLKKNTAQGTQGQGYHEVNDMKGLPWLVDRVFVLERKGYKDPFHVMGEIMLGEL